MEPGAPWRDPRQGYNAYTVGSAAMQMQMQLQQRADATAGGGVLKRSLGELERWQHQQHQQHMAAQHALYLRTVRQRTAPAPDIAAFLGGTPASQPLVRQGSSFGGGLASPSSTLSSLTTVSRAAVPLMHPQPQPQLQRQVPPLVTPQTHAFGLSRASPLPQPAASSELFILQELEKQLLDDDDEPVAAMSGTGSAVTHSEWEETIQQLNNSISAAPSPGVPASATPNTANNNNNAGMTRSPSNSSSSTASSSASCSPPTPGAASRQLLSDAAAAIADGNHEAAATHLAALKRLANQHGDAEQRLIAMMVAALSSRIATTAAAAAPAQHLGELCGAEQRAGSQLLHDISPCFRLALHAANVAIVEAVGNHRAVHLVDFDVSFPQHAALVQCLADRRVPGSSLKVTAVTDPSSPFTQSQTASLAAIGEQLKKLAERAGIEYRLKVVSCRAAELDASRLGCEAGEALAVNLAFALSHVPDESVSPANPRDELLRRVRALGPLVVSLVEQELNTNTAPLAARFTDACAHYGAILESLDATLGRESAEKARAEAALAKKAANAVGREGPDRLERCEVFGKWRARFGMAGFRPVVLGPGIADQVVARVGPAPPGFTVKPENGVLRLCWMGRVVTVASAWR